MSADIADPAVPIATDIAGLEPIERIKSRWPMLFGGLLTVAMILGVARELFDSGFAGLGRAVPTNPMFYVAFGLLYVSLPIADYIIFRRLWRIPIGGLAALVKKRIANEAVLGYSGEAYFYAWARQRSQMVAAPFGAVKDVSILSAIAGNGITLGMIAIALPFGYDLLTAGQFRTLATSSVVVMAITLPFLLFSRRIFSLPQAKLWWIFSVHLVRVCAGAVLLAFAWHFAMPQVSVEMWLLLSAGRLLVSRLPLVPNNDLLFANFAIIFIGQGLALSNLMAFSAALTLLIHGVLIGVLSVYSLFKDPQ